MNRPSEVIPRGLHHFKQQRSAQGMKNEVITKGDLKWPKK